MTRNALSVIIAMAFCVISVAQETRTEKQAGTSREAKAGERASAAIQKKYRNRRVLEVKDPAEFSKSQEKVIFSGPQPGEKLSSFKAIGFQGDRKGKEFDAVALAGANPQVLIFQDDSGVGLRGLFGVASQLSRIAEKTPADLRATTIFLGDDPAKLSSFAGRIADRVGDMLVMGISTDGRDGPGTYGLNRNVSMTVLVAKDGVVTHNFAMPQSMLYADPHVLGAVAEVIGEDRETVASWLNEAPEDTSKMQRQASTPMKAADAGSRKTAFGERIGRLVRSGKLTREEAGELYKAAFGDD